MIWRQVYQFGESLDTALFSVFIYMYVLSLKLLFLFFWNSCIIHISCCLFWSFMSISFSLHRNFYPIFAFLHHGYGRRLHFLSSHSDIPLTPPPKNYITPLSINKYWINYRKRQTTLKLPAPPLLPPLPQPLTTPQQLPLPLPPLHQLPPP